MSKTKLVVGGLAVLAAVTVGLVYIYWVQLVPVVGLAINDVRSLGQPAATLTIEVANDADVTQSPVSAPPSARSEIKPGDWVSYNNTLGSQRYSPLDQINRGNVAQLQVVCVYDTKVHSSFETGPLVVDGAMIGTTEHDIFSINPNTCEENWRTHEASMPSYLQVNHGAAYLDGLLFRGSGDGRVWAFDFKTGARVWETRVAEGQRGESAPAAPIAWNGLVFIGNSGTDNKGVKGRMYALDAKTGKIVWEFYLVPKGENDAPRGPQGTTPLDTSTWANKPGIPIAGGSTWTSYTLDEEKGELYIPVGNPTPDFASGARPGANLYTGSVLVLDAKTGAYRRHFQLVPSDWHDWDVSGAPALIQTRAGRRLMIVTPKDGHMYGFDRDTNTLLYRNPVTRIENTEETFSPDKAVHFCPGSLGGGEWNGPAFDPGSNILVVGEVDWCVTVRMQTDAQLRGTPAWAPWSGMATKNPYHMFGTPDPHSQWGGWVYAVDADTGKWRWRAKSNYPIQSGVTPTAGGLVFLGDMSGEFYALDTLTGKKLWSKDLGGAIGGGVISYASQGPQRVAVAIGFTSVIWPTKVATGKIVVLGVPSP
jgi:alcohol dehydrogenase (cytochrome c)